MLRFVLSIAVALIASSANANSIASISAGPFNNMALSSSSNYGPSAATPSAWAATPTLVSGTETLYYTASTSSPALGPGQYINGLNFTPSTFNFSNAIVQPGITCPSGTAAVVQSGFTPSTSGTTIAVTLTNTVGNCDALFVTVAYAGVTQALTCTDDKANTYTTVRGIENTSTGFSTTAVWVPKLTNSPKTITCTLPTTTTGIRELVDEFSGLGAATLDASASATQDGAGTAPNAVTSGTVTPAFSDFIYGMGVSIQGRGLTPGTGFTGVQAQQSVFYTEFLPSLAPSGTPVAATFTDGNASDNTNALVLAVTPGASSGGTTVGACPSNVCAVVVINGSGSATYTSGGEIYPQITNDTFYSAWCSDGNTYVTGSDGNGFASLAGAYAGVIVLGLMHGNTATSGPPTALNNFPDWGTGTQDSQVAESLLCIGTGGTDELYMPLDGQWSPEPYTAWQFPEYNSTIISSPNHGTAFYPDPTTGGLKLENVYSAGLVPTSMTLVNGVLTISYNSTSLFPNATYRVGDSVYISGVTTGAANGFGIVTTPGTCNTVALTCSGLVIQLFQSVASATVTVGASAVMYPEDAPASDYTCASGCPSTVTAPMWPHSTVAHPSFIQYGEGYSNTYADGQCCGGSTMPDLASKYVYALFSGGSGVPTTTSTQYMYLGRVPWGNGPGSTPDISNLRSSDWQYYCGGDGTTTSNWTLASTPGLFPTSGNGGGMSGTNSVDGQPLSACPAVPVMSDPDYQMAAPGQGKLGAAVEVQYIPPSISTAGNGGVYLSIVTNFTAQLVATQTGQPWTYGYISSSSISGGLQTVNFPCSGSGAAAQWAGQSIVITGASPSAFNTNAQGVQGTPTYSGGICTLTINNAGSGSYVSGGTIYPSTPAEEYNDTTWIAWQAPHPWGSGTGAWNTGATVPWCKFQVMQFGAGGSDGMYLPNPLVQSLSADRTTQTAIMAADQNNADLNATYSPHASQLTFTYNASSSGNLCGF